MGLTLTEFRDKLAIDLKITIDTEMSKVELNRCIERAVDDLSRVMPLEKVHEVTLDFTVTDESITTPAAASATAIVNAADISSTVSGGTLSIADYTPEVPRRLTVTLTDADGSITALTILVKGYDQDGNYVEEGWYLKDLLVSGTAYQGSVHFKRITEVEVDNIAGGGASDTLSIGTGNAYDSHIFLGNKPIRHGTEKVTSDPSGTTYTRDTDYTMDYANGAIKYISGGNMAAGTAYLVSYTKSRLGIDVSSILPIVTRIQRVNYPVDLIPQQFVSFNITGDFMYIGSQKTGESQVELQDKEHLAIYYERKHHPPGDGSPGSYPGYLDEIIAIGAGGYAFLIEAVEYEFRAITDIGYVDTALDKVALYLETNGGSDPDNAKEVLANINDDLSDLRTAIVTAVDATNTYLDKVSTTDLDASTPDSAIEVLKKYEDKINLVNIGNEVAELGANYARAWTSIATARTAAALGFAQEAQIRLSNIRSYIEEAGGWNRIAEDFIAEANSRIQNANQFLVISDRFRAEGLLRLEKFYSLLKDRSEYRRKVSSTPVRQPA